MIWLIWTDLSITSGKNATIAARAKDLLRFEPRDAMPSRRRLAAMPHERLPRHIHEFSSIPSAMDAGF
jgi:hypothetical protein